MYTYVFMTSVRVIPVSAVLSRVPYEWLYLQKWVTPPLSLTEPQAVLYGDTRLSSSLRVWPTSNVAQRG